MTRFCYQLTFQMFVCDTDIDCLDGSDEINCDPTEIKNRQKTCPSPNISCDNYTKCITPAQMCDHKQDCQDFTDEGVACNSTRNPAVLHNCEYPNRLCDNDTKCIQADQLCDEVMTYLNNFV